VVFVSFIYFFVNTVGDIAKNLSAVGDSA
jgi:hypothetical protein